MSMQKLSYAKELYTKIHSPGFFLRPLVRTPLSNFAAGGACNATSAVRSTAAFSDKKAYGINMLSASSHGATGFLEFAMRPNSIMIA